MKTAAPTMAHGGPATRQRILPLEISARSALITLETVRITRGCDAESVLDSVGDATHPKFLRWVFNLAVKPDGEIRQLRFFKEEIAGILPEGHRDFEPGVIIDRILGDRRAFPRGEIEVLFTTHSATLTRLIRAGELAEVNHQLTRASLAALLARRLI